MKIAQWLEICLYFIQIKDCYGSFVQLPQSTKLFNSWTTWEVMDAYSDPAVPLDSTVEERKGLKTFSKLCALRGDISLAFQTVPTPRLCATSSFVNPALALAHINRSDLTIASIRLLISHHSLHYSSSIFLHARSQANNQLPLALVLRK